MLLNFALKKLHNHITIAFNELGKLYIYYGLVRFTTKDLVNNGIHKNYTRIFLLYLVLNLVSANCLFWDCKLSVTDAWLQ